MCHQAKRALHWIKSMIPGNVIHEGDFHMATCTLTIATPSTCLLKPKANSHLWTFFRPSHPPHPVSPLSCHTADTLITIIRLSTWNTAIFSCLVHYPGWPLKNHQSPFVVLLRHLPLSPVLCLKWTLRPGVTWCHLPLLTSASTPSPWLALPQPPSPSSLAVAWTKPFPQGAHPCSLWLELSRARSLRS